MSPKSCRGSNPGDPTASDELLPLVYEELRRLAAHRLAQEKSGQTLPATALVHEAYNLPFLVILRMTVPMLITATHAIMSVVSSRKSDDLPEFCRAIFEL